MVAIYAESAEAFWNYAVDYGTPEPDQAGDA